MITSAYLRYQRFLIPALILLTSIVIAGFVVHSKIAHAGVTYGWVVTQDCVDTWPECSPWSSGSCSGPCNAGNVGAHCQNFQCNGGPAGCNAIITNVDCVATGCSPDNSCAASTCSSATCSDGCGGQVQGTKTDGPCAPPPPTCTPDTSCAANTCNTSTCTATAANCSTYQIAGTMDCSAPPPPPPPPTCTPDTSCAANTCTTSTCTATAGDCSTYQIAGTKTTGVCAAPPPTCNNPTVSITASPNRVKSGQTTTLKITGTGLTNGCTVTGPGVNQMINPTSCNFSPNPTPITTPAITKQVTYTVTCTDIASATTTIVNLTPVFSPF